jgi:hypothetical protein
MLRDYLIAIAAGISSALVYALAGSNLFLALLLLPFCTVPLFFVGLSQGYRAVFVAGGVAAILPGLFLFDFLVSLSFTIMFFAPVVILVRSALVNRTDSDGHTEWYPSGRLLALAASYFALFFIGLVAIASSYDGGMLELIEDRLSLLVGEFAQSSPNPDGQTYEDALNALAYNAAIGISSFAVICLAVSMMLAQALSRRLGKSLRSSFELVDIKLPRWLSYAFAASLGLALITSGPWSLMGAGLASTFATPYFFLGIAVVHSIARRLSAGIIVLIALYALLLFGQPFSMMALAGLGLAEQWINVRRRFGGGGSGPGGSGQNLTRQE